MTPWRKARETDLAIFEQSGTQQNVGVSAGDAPSPPGQNSHMCLARHGDKNSNAKTEKGERCTQ